MTASALPNLASLLDDAKCFELIRRHRWPDGPRCPRCDSGSVVRDGHDEAQRHRQRHRCKACGARFDDLSGTVLAGHHQPLRLWVLCLYFMGLNLSSSQIARELGLNENDVQIMASQLREGLTARAPEATLEGVVEIDEVYVVAGHKGNPAAVQKKAVPGAVVRAIAMLGSGLGMTVIAEGVETLNQARMVEADGCTEIQGYLISRPIPAADISALLARDLNPALAA